MEACKDIVAGGNFTNMTMLLIVQRDSLKGNILLKGCLLKVCFKYEKE